MHFDYFNSVLNNDLRAFNRLNFANNLWEFKGRAYAEDYIAGISEDDQKEMHRMGSLIKQHGRTKVIAQIRGEVQYA